VTTEAELLEDLRRFVANLAMPPAAKVEARRLVAEMEKAEHDAARLLDPEMAHREDLVTSIAEELCDFGRFYDHEYGANDDSFEVAGKIIGMVLRHPTGEPDDDDWLDVLAEMEREPDPLDPSDPMWGEWDPPIMHTYDEWDDPSSF
jgi:hypothetical protein